MSNNDKENGYHALKVSKFDHSSTTPGDTRWREWVVKLRYAFGSVYPFLANQTSEVLDPFQYWWGLTWSPLLDFDNFNQEQEQKLYVDFQKAQYSLLHVLPKPSTLNLTVVDCNASVIVTVARRSSISVSGGLGYPQPPEAIVKWFSVASPGPLGILRKTQFLRYYSVREAN